MDNNWHKELNLYFDWLNEKEELAVKPWVIGVSGGADSLALVYLINEWSKNKKIIVLTVDHGLRPSSKTEAEYVHRLMKEKGIEHHILEWIGDKPKTGIEELARTVRYDLMKKWCFQRGFNNLFIAHHKRDQAETFLMRLQRGSGVDGLSSMAPISRWAGLNIIRPLLGVDPEDLRKYLNEKNISWVEDESNTSDDYLRVRIRKLLPELESYLGISLDRLCNTALEMARARDYLEKQTEKFIEDNVKDWEGCGYSFSSKSLADLHEEIGLRVLRTLFKKVGKKIYPVNRTGIELVYHALKSTNFKGRTIGGCEIFEFRKKIWIVPELKGKVKLSKKDWEEFVKSHPQFERQELPAKLRQALFVSHS